MKEFEAKPSEKWREAGLEMNVETGVEVMRNRQSCLL